MQKQLTTKDIAERLGYSSQHVRITARKLDIQPTKQGKTFVFTDSQFRQIEEYLKGQSDSPKDSNEAQETEIERLKQLLADKDKILTDKDSQIDFLREQVKTLTDANRALSYSIAGNTQKGLIEPTDKDKELTNADNFETAKDNERKRGIIERFVIWLKGE